VLGCALADAMPLAAFFEASACDLRRIARLSAAETERE
jgi:hypothetical protein